MNISEIDKIVENRTEYLQCLFPQARTKELLRTELLANQPLLNDLKSQRNTRTKGMIHEGGVKETIKLFFDSRGQAYSITDMNASGPKAERYSEIDGSAVIGETDDNRFDLTKCADMKFCLPETNLIIWSKLTNGTGGSQDNVAREINSLFRTARLNTDPSLKFIAIVDGTFFTEKIFKLLQRHLVEGKSYLVRKSDLDSFLEQFVED